MRFKIRPLQSQSKHEDMCTSVSWCSFNELTRYLSPHSASVMIMSSINGMSTPDSPVNGLISTPTPSITIGCPSAEVPAMLQPSDSPMAPSSSSIKMAKSRSISPTKPIKSPSSHSGGATMEEHLPPLVKMAQ